MLQEGSTEKQSEVMNYLKGQLILSEGGNNINSLDNKYTVL